MTSARPVPPLLVSHAQDRATVQIGGAAWQRVPDLAAHQPLGGTIVDTWADTDGERHILVLSFRGRKGNLEAHRYPLLASECASIEPSDPARCWRTARLIFAFLGQRQSLAGPALNDYEETIRSYAWALLRAAQPTTGEAA